LQLTGFAARFANGMFSDASMTTEPFSVVIVYEHFDGVIHAKEVATRLFPETKLQCGISYRSWQFDFLRDQTLRQQALTGALQAGMVILAVNGETELPAHVKQWLEDWLLQKKSDSTDLLVLLDLPPQIDGEVHRPLAYLQWIGEACRLDFCFQTTGLRTTGHSIHFSNQPAGGSARAYRGWSIND
jgi:hypothetical protein